VLFSILFSRLFTQLGLPPHGGLALANSLATALEMIGLLVFMRRRLGGLEGKKIIQGSLQAVAAALVMGLGLAAWLIFTTGRPAWMAVAGGLLTGAVLYGVSVLGLGIPEARSLVRVLKRRLNFS